MNSRTNFDYRSLFRIAVISVFCFGIPAFSVQSLYVNPMVIEVNPYPGMKVETDLEIRNSSDMTQYVQFDQCELTQGRNGFWKIIEGADIVSNQVKEISCNDWISLSESKLTVAPRQSIIVKVRLKIPPAVKGFYLSGLTATLSPTEEPTGVGLVVRFLIPVLVNIRARAQLQKLTLTDIGMKFRPDSSSLPASTLITMTIANEGKTFSSVEGNVTLKKRVGKNWRRITDTYFRKTKIIPNVEVQFVTDIERQLPSGQYKLFGQIKIGGRRAKPLDKIIKFKGDPTITDAATDAAIEVTPRYITIETIQGATRNTIIQVSNASEAGSVEVHASLVVPETLKGVAMGALRGEDLTCPDWLTVRPNKFKLRAGARQNIKIISKVPNSEMAYANYYASLNLRSIYSNGQSAGSSSALVCVHNKNSESEPRGQVMNLTVNAEKPSRYVVTAQFGNVGNIHYIPKCRAVIYDAKGMIKANLNLKGNAFPMFPLEVRGFSEVIDFSMFEAGRYYIEPIMDYGTGNLASARLPIQISIEGRERMVEIVTPKLEARK